MVVGNSTDIPANCSRKMLHMIIRKLASGQAIAITQTDHSRLAGFFAAHWGNATFAPLQPYESVTRAATFHDFGWLRYETQPEVDPASGEPYTFTSMPFRAEQLEAYQWCVDWLAGVDAYSALLVGMHRVGLWKSRYDTITQPAWQSPPNLPLPIQEFVTRSEPLLQQQRQALGESGVWTNYRLLQVWDLLGLYFTTREPYENAIQPVPVAYDADLHSGVQMTLHPLGEHRVAFEPYPFDVRPLTLHIPFRTFNAQSFADNDAFRRAYFQALPEMLSYTVE
jgi:hypothetical protein